MAVVISTSLTDYQYVKFLQFCKKNKISKSPCARNAVLKYCKIQKKDSLMYESIIDELDQLLRKNKK